MNSYPAELLTQLAPVMFVAGLAVPPDHQQDQFTTLTRRLRDALLSRKTAIYQPDKTNSFHVVFVEKSVRFPPRKILPDDPQYLTAHSPLSPLTPTSPLFPDGLIAPIWIRKHTTFVPSVFVLFLRIFELPAINPSSPLHPPDPDRERERADEERQRDTELAAEIAQRKKSTTERGIKLTVVLTATRRMLGAFIVSVVGYLISDIA
jgi:trafficking protein particle complex subunit 11